MLTDLQLALTTLENGAYTCVVCKGNTVYNATDRGVKPLLHWLESGIDLNGFSAADRIVGRATAFLYVLLGVTAVHAHVMSRPAAAVLNDFGIFCQCDTLVDGIVNRSGDGPCPFEAAVMDITDPAHALTAIRQKQQQLRKGATK